MKEIDDYTVIYGPMPEIDSDGMDDDNYIDDDPIRYKSPLLYGPPPIIDLDRVREKKGFLSRLLHRSKNDG
ncbi:MAG: hypothetical protein PHU62_09895 [Bacteroidales bacterium]|jgi:hypothetical protein|nr:hypothetical protein [Bacteroidales bacterium]MDD2205585.1 hypothetical protein [Bacteroidales bacterium]MDD3152453.1 hypothetical protein [Bacteroidales bacterium]MDD3915028.1 hypothetical protein [Bacteroidales bacterium]MDD4634861.1 hypothetical protein [Bacteroidales bacterium]